MIKKRFISMLVLLAAVATGAVAQTTYKVSGRRYGGESHLQRREEGEERQGCEEGSRWPTLLEADAE